LADSNKEERGEVPLPWLERGKGGGSGVKGLGREGGKKLAAPYYGNGEGKKGYKWARA